MQGKFCAGKTALFCSNASPFKKIVFLLLVYGNFDCPSELSKNIFSFKIYIKITKIKLADMPIVSVNAYIPIFLSQNIGICECKKI